MTLASPYVYEVVSSKLGVNLPDIVAMDFSKIKPPVLTILQCLTVPLPILQLRYSLFVATHTTYCNSLRAAEDGWVVFGVKS